MSCDGVTDRICDTSHNNTVALNTSHNNTVAFITLMHPVIYNLLNIFHNLLARCMLLVLRSSKHYNSALYSLIILGVLCVHVYDT